ncbi:MAG: Holliday junction resolvase RuvX [Bifidobacteriaceae bacterium]|jgi:putative Holliday junction resolvase|nr:Holliday junction resolvase RuvX [Bifidobacteriaceae bacterium]
MTYLAIDYGKARIGLAIAKEPYILAVPYKTVQNSENSGNEIADIIRKEKVKKLIIGKPVSLKGHDEQAVGDTKLWIEKSLIPAISGQSNSIPEIVFADERLTTANAKKKLLDLQTKKGKKSRKNDKEIIDQMAAVEILNSVL